MSFQKSSDAFCNNANFGSMTSFDDRVLALDTSLFDAIYTQLYLEDKQSLLAVQKAVRDQVNPFCYLEIGSYTGGSIQPYLRDPRCFKIYSIDKRITVPPDERGNTQTYPENSRERMLNLLTEVSAEDVKKITCIDDDASNIAPAVIAERPNICFIDGEHTERAVVSDFRFCRSVLAGKGVICFHDSHIIFKGLHKIIEQLQAERARFWAYVLPLNVFVIEFGEFRISQKSYVLSMLEHNHVSYLSGLMSMEHYREVYNSRTVRILRFVNRRIVELRHRLQSLPFIKQPR